MPDGRSIPRFSRSQRFALSSRGRTLVVEYRALIRAVRTRGEHAVFERACSEWAARNELESDDGLYLAELEKTAATLAQLTEALEVCGQSRADVTRSVGRLVDARLLVLSP